MAERFFVRAREIITCSTSAPQGGVTFDDLERVPSGLLAVVGSRIHHIERESLDVLRMLSKTGFEEVDCRDCVVVPGFVDAHCHPLFAGDREADFVARTRGEKPQQGMLHTVESTRQALRDLAGFYEITVRPRLRTMLAHGTTTLETKTGYALTKEGEFALLDLIDAHRDDADIPKLIATFLGAHTVPPEFDSSGAYIDVLIDDCLPKVGAHGADFADVFCEPGFFSAEEARRYLQAAKDNGLPLRAHCDEMANGGATLMAAKMGVASFDHCNEIGEREIEAILASDGVLVACPATIEFLGLEKQAPVREVLDRGGTVALASDFNPGTSPCFNLQTIAYYGRRFFGMSAAEALYAVTRAAASSTRPSLRGGSGELHVGGDADCVALQIDDLREFGWYFGGNLAKRVVRGGVLACSS